MPDRKVLFIFSGGTGCMSTNSTKQANDTKQSNMSSNEPITQFDKDAGKFIYTKHTRRGDVKIEINNTSNNVDELLRIVVESYIKRNGLT